MVSGAALVDDHALNTPSSAYAMLNFAVGFAITTAAVPDLDSTNLVVGRVVSGASLVDDLAALPAVKANSSSPFFRRVPPCKQRARFYAKATRSCTNLPSDVTALPALPGYFCRVMARVCWAVTVALQGRHANLDVRSSPARPPLQGAACQVSGAFAEFCLGCAG